MTITYLQPVESRQMSETGLQQSAARLGGAYLLVLQHQFGPAGRVVGGEEAQRPLHEVGAGQFKTGWLAGTHPDSAAALSSLGGGMGADL